MFRKDAEKQLQTSQDNKSLGRETRTSDLVPTNTQNIYYFGEAISAWKDNTKRSKMFVHFPTYY
jgi:hypothetical protein